MNFLKLLTLCLFLISIDVDGFSQKPVAPLIEKLEEILVTENIPGAMISIVNSDSIIFSGGIGYADLEKKELVTKQHLFRQASISKSFTALGIVKLFHKKNISLSTPISQIDENLKLENAWKETTPITVEQVLEHTAGFDEVHHLNKKEILEGATCKSLVDANINSLYARWKPGTRMAYSNAGYLLAGHLIEEVANQPYNEYLAKEILSPLNMETAGFYYKVPDNLPLATGYYNEGGKFFPVTSNTHASAAGDLCANATDMAHFLQFMINRGFENTAENILPAAAFDRIENAKTSLAAKKGFTRGYSLANSNRWWNDYLFHGHDGSISGFSSLYLYSREANIGIAVAINSRDDLFAIFDEIIDYYAPKRKEDYSTNLSPIPTNVKETYEGFYNFYSPRNQLSAFLESTANGVSLVFSEDVLLVKDYFGDIQDTLFHRGNNLYHRKGESIPFVLLFENDKGAPALWLGNEYAEKGSKFIRTTKNAGMAISFLWTILFVVIGFIGLLRQFFSKSKKSKRSRLLPWLAAFSFLLMPFGIILSGEILDSPTSFNLGTIILFLASISFFVFSIWTLFQSFKLPEESLGFKIYYRFTAYSLTFVALLLLMNDLIGFRLWAY